MTNKQEWEKHYKFDTEPKTDVDTKLDQGGKPTKAFWKIWHRIKNLFKELNEKIAEGWFVYDEAGDMIKNGFLIDEKELVLGVKHENGNCGVYYGWQWIEGDETLTDYKKQFSQWKLMPPNSWKKIKL